MPASVNVTEWFPGHVQPVHKGVYERRCDEKHGGPIYSYWDGEMWGVNARCVESAAAQPYPRGAYSMSQHTPWRGVTEPPEPIDDEAVVTRALVFYRDAAWARATTLAEARRKTRFVIRKEVVDKAFITAMEIDEVIQRRQGHLAS